MIWVTADHHFNHHNIIEYANRPFMNSVDMNKFLIARHNSRVNPNDVVYILGDFKMTNNGPTFYDLKKELNGELVFIRGNHDRNNGVNGGLEYAVIRTFSLNILMIHDPEDAMRLIELDRTIDLALVGHVHNVWKFRGIMVNVGVDVWDYYPVHIKQILKARKEWVRENGGNN